MKQRPLLWLLRFLITALLCGWLVSTVDVSGLAEMLRTARPRWIATGLVVYAMAHLLYAASVQQVLAGLDVRVALPTLISNHYRGLFVNNFLPTNMGGDIYKMAHLGRLTGSRAPASMAIAIQRILALLATILWVVVSLPLLGHWSLRLNALTVAGLGIALIILLLLLFRPLPAFGPRLLARLPSGEKGVEVWRSIEQRVARLIASGRLRSVLLRILAYQLCMIGTVWCLAQALGLPADWRPFVYLVPLSVLAGAIPVSINGIGVREGVYVYTSQA
jgi:glycosyltransferase 2 family protein